jgi:hypothetical protein
MPDAQKYGKPGTEGSAGGAGTEPPMNTNSPNWRFWLKFLMRPNAVHILNRRGIIFSDFVEKYLTAGCCLSINSQPGTDEFITIKMRTAAGGVNPYRGQRTGR